MSTVRVVMTRIVCEVTCHCILLLSVLILYDLIGKFDLLMIQFLPEVDINLNIGNHASVKTNTQV